MGCLAMDAPRFKDIYCWCSHFSRRAYLALIRSKIKQIEYRQCNYGTGEPKTENVARIVPCDALSGAGSPDISIGRLALGSEMFPLRLL